MPEVTVKKKETGTRIEDLTETRNSTLTLEEPPTDFQPEVDSTFDLSKLSLPSETRKTIKEEIAAEANPSATRISDFPECIRFKDVADPEALLKQLNEGAEREGLNQPVAGVFVAPTGEKLILTGKLYETGRKLEQAYHLFKNGIEKISDIDGLYQSSDGFLRDAAVISDMKFAFGNTIRRWNGSIIDGQRSRVGLRETEEFQSFEKITDTMREKFYSAVMKFPHFSDNLKREQLENNSSLYRHKDKPWDASDVRIRTIPAIYHYALYGPIDLINKTASVIKPFIFGDRERPAVTEPGNTLEQHLEHTLTNPSLDSMFETQDKLLQSILTSGETPNQKDLTYARYSIRTGSLLLEDVRRDLAGLFSATDQTVALDALPETSPIRKFSIKAKEDDGFIKVQMPTESLPLTITLSDYPELGSAITAAISGERSFVDNPDIARERAGVFNLVANGNLEGFSVTLNEKKEDGQAIIIATISNNENEVTLPLGLSARENGRVSIIVPKFEFLREAAQNSTLTIRDLGVSSSDNPALLVLSGENILNVNHEERTCKFREPTGTPAHSWILRKLAGTWNTPETMERTESYADKLVTLLTHSRVENYDVTAELKEDKKKLAAGREYHQSIQDFQQARLRLRSGRYSEPIQTDLE